MKNLRGSLDAAGALRAPLMFAGVCWAWHRTGEVEVLSSGVRRAKDQEKGKGVIARCGLKEAQSHSDYSN